MSLGSMLPLQLTMDALIQPQEPCDQQQLVTCKLLADWPVPSKKYLPPPLLPVRWVLENYITPPGVFIVSKIIHYNAFLFYPIVCSCSTRDCTLIVPSAHPETMVVSLMSTATTMSSCLLSVIFSVMSVGDLIFHTLTVWSFRHKHTHHSNDNEEYRST